VPWFSYHSGHSGEFCRHAKGELQAVVEAAIARGFTHYGLSEHCPRDRVQDLYPEELALGPDALAAAFSAYVAKALSLRDRFGDRIELLVGFETERLPPDSWVQRMTALIELEQALRPEIVGHLDLVRKFDGPGASFSPAAMRHVERALEAVHASGAMLDVNCGAARRGYSPVYPLPEILARACRMGIAVTLGDDSHGAHDVGVGLDGCMTAIAAAGYREVSYLARRDGVVTRCSAALDAVRPATAG
jgi:histidinol-phosphatase (PHP family)